MAEYIIYHGDFDSDLTDPGLVAIKADGTKLTIRASRKLINEWKIRLENSRVLQGSVNDGQVNLENYILANKYSTWTFFTDNDFDEYKELYNSIKGSTVIVNIKPEVRKD